MNSNLFLTAFENPVDDSQLVFRELLKAMSEPGYIAPVREMPMNESTLFSSTWSIALALLDHDTEVYLSPTLRGESVMKSISFQTDARLTEEAERADFAIINIEEIELITSLKTGSIERPHESCTVLLQVPAFDSAHLIELSGPGIRDEKLVSFPNVRDSALQMLRNNYQLYPCGLDFVFCTPSEFFALPRTTKLGNKLPSDSKGESVCM